MKCKIILLVCLLLLPSMVFSQEVVISGFPTGVGRSVDADFFKPYQKDLQIIADSLHKYPLAVAIITGGADGQTFKDGDDSKNPSLALGRAHTLRNFLITKFNINRLQIIISSEEVSSKGADGRFASVYISHDSKEIIRLGDRLSAIEAQPSTGDLLTRIQALEELPPVEKHFTEVNNFSEKFGLQVSAGFSSSPFGGIPIVGGAVTWDKTLFFELNVGHTLWKNDFTHADLDLRTNRRLIGGQILLFPFENKQIGLLGGWIRIEEISNQYHEYVKMSEGVVLGARFIPFENISLTAAYNPSKHKLISDEQSIFKNDQFSISLNYYKILGGGE